MIELTELYNGEVLCEFNKARHTHTIVNKGKRFKVPSVTRITSVLDKSGPLVGWAVNQTLDVCKGAIAPGVEYAETYLDAVWVAAKRAHVDAKTEAARRGTELHKRLESELKAGLGLSPESWPDDSRRWIESFRFNHLERRIYSRRYRYSGTTDAIAEDGLSNKLVLIDWKTGKSLYPEYRLQTAAYVHAFEEEFPDQKIAGRYLVRIAEDGSVEPHYYPRSTLRKDFQAFLGAKVLFDRVQQIEKESK